MRGNFGTVLLRFDRSCSRLRGWTRKVGEPRTDGWAEYNGGTFGASDDIKATADVIVSLVDVPVLRAATDWDDAASLAAFQTEVKDRQVIKGPGLVG